MDTFGYVVLKHESLLHTILECHVEGSNCRRRSQLAYVKSDIARHILHRFIAKRTAEKRT